MLKFVIGMILGMTTVQAAYSNKVIQRWAVPDGVTRIQVTYKDQFGRILARQDMDVQPKNIFEVVPLQ